MAARHDVLTVALTFVMILLSLTVKKRAFTQPDDIFMAVSKVKNDVGIENYFISSLFVYQSSNNLYLKYRKRSLFLILILLCRDYETQPGPPTVSLSKEESRMFL